ncbi:MAG: miaA1-2 [Bacteroidetes bacterium]|nr:miaA1-2 [Bacteroidota bacterium]
MKKLIVLLGPTGVGKTELSLRLAEYFSSPVLSADSRQIYKDMAIGTAAPTEEQLSRVKHYFVQQLEPTEYYNAAQFEKEVLDLLEKLHQQHPVVVLAGGSMMYIDAVCKGIDDLPNVDETLRRELKEKVQKEGLEPIRQQLRLLDPVFYNRVDLKNTQRLIHALEICLMTGVPYSTLRTNQSRQRPFQIVKIGLHRDREELYRRINLRVDEMIANGLEQECHNLSQYRGNNALNTVGYKEIYSYFDGECTRDFTIEKIKQNTRIYSRKQMTWFKRDKEICWINLSEKQQDEALKEIIAMVDAH